MDRRIALAATGLAPLSLLLALLASTLLGPAPAAVATGPRDADVEKEAFARIYFFFEDAAEEEARDRLYRKALRRFEEHLAAYPEGETLQHTRFHIAECHHYLGDAARAAEGWSAALEGKDTRITGRAHIRLADRRYAEQKYEEALEHYRAGAKDAPSKEESLRSRLYQGICLYFLKEHEQAKEILERLMEEVGSGYTHTVAKRYVERLKPVDEEASSVTDMIRRFHRDVGEYQKTGPNDEKRKELAESVRTNIQDWDSIDDPKILQTLLEVLNTQKHPFAANAIAELVQKGTPGAVDPLVAKLSDKSEALRPTILSNLVSGKKRVADAEADAIFTDDGEKNTGLRVQAANYIALADDAGAVEKLYSKIMLGEDTRVKVNTALNDGIHKALLRLTSSEAAAALRRIVADSKRHPMERRFAVDALGHIGDPQALDELVPLLEERSLEIVSLAAEALGRMGDQRALEPLLGLLRKKPKDPALLQSLLRGLDALEIPESEEDLFIDLTKSKDHGVKVLTYGLLRQTNGPEAQKALRKALSDKTWQVRWHAIRAIGQVPSAENVGDLIARLPKEGGRLKFQILKYLHRMTGKDIGPDEKEWKKWWSGAEATFDPAAVKVADLALGPDPEETMTAKDEVPTYFTIEVKSNNAVFVIDVSGSMVGEITVPKEGEVTGDGKEKKIAVAKRELIRVLQAFDKRTHFNIVWFETKYRALWEEMKPASKPNVAGAVKAVRGFNAAGATNIFDSMEFALKDPRVDTIYLLSDGEPTAGQYVNPTDILREVKAINYTRKATIHTIFLGGESSFMKRLAEENRGKYIPVAK